MRLPILLNYGSMDFVRLRGVGSRGITLKDAKTSKNIRSLDIGDTPYRGQQSFQSHCFWCREVRRISLSMKSGYEMNTLVCCARAIRKAWSKCPGEYEASLRHKIMAFSGSAAAWVTKLSPLLNLSIVAIISVSFFGQPLVFRVRLRFSRRY